jgi:hypothetical protein
MFPGRRCRVKPRRWTPTVPRGTLPGCRVTTGYTEGHGRGETSFPGHLSRRTESSHGVATRPSPPFRPGSTCSTWNTDEGTRRQESAFHVEHPTVGLLPIVGSADGRGTFGVFAPRSRTPSDGPFQINGTRRRVATHGASRAIPPRRSSRAHRRLSAGVFHPARNDPEPPMCGDCVDSADGARSRVAHNRSSEPADRQQQDGTVHQRQRTHPSTPSTGPAAVLRQPPQPTPCAPPATQPGLARSLATVRHPDQARPAQPAERA